MTLPLAQFGSIEDVQLGCRWDQVTLANEVTRRAVLLSELGLSRRSKVAIAHTGSARFFADLFATWTIGATAACLDSSLSENEITRVIDALKPAAILVDGSGDGVDGKFGIPLLDLAGAPATDCATAPGFDPDDPALVLFTSGTTGVPKGVVLTFRALWARIASNIEVIGKSTLARTLVTLPTHFGHGLIGNSLTPLMAGGDILLHPLGLPLAQGLGRLIDDNQITFLSSVPALWRLATSHGRSPSGSSLQRVHVGSAPLSARLWSDIAAWCSSETVNCYGATEAANWMAGASSRVDGINDGLVGRAWGCSVAVFDDNGVIHSTGEGEIAVRSPSLMSGYLDRPDLTAAVLRDGWFHTGDRGSVDERGRIWLRGRLKEEINRAGRKVQPVEIDMLLESHPEVAEACTFGIPDAVSGEVIGVAIRLGEGATTNPPALQAWCRNQANRAIVPERWFIVDAIPRNARGKVDRAAVRRALTETLTSGAFAPDAPIGDGNAGKSASFGVAKRPDHAGAKVAVWEAVKRAWAEVLDEDSFRSDLPWDQAGGDSLQTLRLWFRIEEMLGTRLSFDAMKPDATPSELIDAIQKYIDLSDRGPSAQREADGPALVFFLPPAEGDAPSLAQFRAEFGRDLRFLTIQYPSWREMIDGGGGFDLIVDAAVRQIRAQPRGGHLVLVGYSFGGFVACEAARRLKETGSQVGLLGLIDTRLQPAGASERAGHRAFQKIGKLIRSIFVRPTRVLAISWERVRSWFWTKSPLRLLRLLGAFATRLPSKAAFNFHQQLIVNLRSNSQRRSVLKPLMVPTTLFLSDQNLASVSAWREICEQLRVIQIGGSHLSIIRPPFSGVLRERIVEAVQGALSRVSAPTRALSFSPGIEKLSLASEKLRPASTRKELRDFDA